jgi:hypothetical protein
VTPLSPDGEAAQGEHPPNPTFSRFFIDLMKGCRNIGGCPGGGGGSTMCRSPRNDFMFLSRISTEPVLTKKHQFPERFMVIQVISYRLGGFTPDQYTYKKGLLKNS